MSLSSRFSRVSIGVFAVVLFATCGKSDGTYVLLKFDGTVSSGGSIAKIEIGTTLAGHADATTFAVAAGSAITLPSSGYLDIGVGEGDLAVHAVAQASDGSPLGEGDGRGSVFRGKTVTVAITFAPVTGRIDAGMPGDAAAADAQPGFDLVSLDLADATVDAATGSDAAEVGQALDSGTSADHSVAAVGGSTGFDGALASGGNAGTAGASGAAPSTGGSTGASTTGGTTSTGGSGGTLPETKLAPAPERLTFPQTPVGTTSPAQSLGLTNTSSAAIGPLSVATQDPVQFPIATNDCGGKTLLPGTGCSIAVSFKPASASTQASNVAVNAPGLPQLLVPLTGHGVNQVSAIEIAPTFYDFGTLDITGLGALYTFTIRNTGNMPTVVAKVGIDPPGPPYDLIDDTCTGTRITPAEHCTFAVQFKPAAPGIYINALNVSTTTGAGVSISVKGAGK